MSEITSTSPPASTTGPLASSTSTSTSTSTSEKKYKNGMLLKNAEYNSRSPYWKYYYKYCLHANPNKAGFAVCKTCMKEYDVRKSVSGLKTYFQTHERKEKRLSEHFQKSQQSTKKQKISIQDKLECFKLTPKEELAEKYLQAATAWIVEENLPFKTVEKKSFKRMIDTVTTNSPQSAPILTYRDIREEVENLGNLCRDSIKKELKGKYFSVTTDHWTSNANENYSCLTAHWIGEEYVMRHAVLGFYLHEGRTRGEDIANLFVQDFERYNFDLSYVVAIVTDTTGNMNTFGQHLRSLGVIHLYCVDHNLHLCAKLAFDDNNIPGSAQVMKTARSLCEYFDKSSQASDKLKAQQVAMNPDKCPLKLIQDVITRWWSTR